MIVGHAVEGDLAPLGVERRVGGGRVAVARLADRSDDGDPPSRLADRNGGVRSRRERAHLALHCFEIQNLIVQVAAERVGGARGVGAFLRRPGTVDVIPTFGRGSGRMHEAHLRAVHPQRQAGQKALLFFRHRFASPVQCRARMVVEVAHRPVDCFVVVAFDRDRAFGGLLHNGTDDGDRVCAISDQVAQEHQLIGAAGNRVREARIQRLEVGMDVGE